MGTVLADDYYLYSFVFVRMEGKARWAQCPGEAAKIQAVVGI